MLELVDVFEQDIKEENIEEFHDTIQVFGKYEPEIPKFIKEVRVSLSKLSESEIFSYTQKAVKETINDGIRSNERNANKCKMCGIILASEKLLQMHKEIVHPKSNIVHLQYSCDKCEKMFSTKAHFLRHVKSVHDNVRYNCDKCNKSFSRIDMLQRHIKSIHEKVRFRCDKCDTSFSEKGTLQRHIKSAHMKIRYNCNKCEKCFSLKNNLKRHIKRVHEIPKEPQLEKEQ